MKLTLCRFQSARYTPEDHLVSMQQDKQQNKERIKESQEAMHKNLLFSPSTLSTAEPQGPMGG